MLHPRTSRGEHSFGHARESGPFPPRPPTLMRWAPSKSSFSSYRAGSELALSSQGPSIFRGALLRSKDLLGARESSDFELIGRNPLSSFNQTSSLTSPFFASSLAFPAFSDLLVHASSSMRPSTHSSHQPSILPRLPTYPPPLPRNHLWRPSSSDTFALPLPSASNPTRHQLRTISLSSSFNACQIHHLPSDVPQRRQEARSRPFRSCVCRDGSHVG